MEQQRLDWRNRQDKKKLKKMFRKSHDIWIEETQKYVLVKKQD